MIPLDQPGAVIGGEDNQGIIIHAMFLECVKDTAGVVVDFLDHIAIDSTGTLSFEVLGNEKGRVGHGVGEVDEKGFLFLYAFLDEPDAFVSDSPGNGPLIERKFNAFLITHQGNLVLELGLVSGFGIGKGFFDCLL